MNSLQGQLLVASPHLVDPSFYRSVVLLVQHDEDGAFGLILNRPTENKVEEVWELLSDEPCGCDQSVNHGGPVEGPLTSIHTVPSCSEDEIIPGLYFASRRESLADLLSRAAEQYRLFVGYAGWASGQLEAELEAGGWLTTPASANDVFADPDELWKLVVRRIGLEILAPSIRDKHIPVDPSVN
jgi:putative transcriptional regulator